MIQTDLTQPVTDMTYVAPSPAVTDWSVWSLCADGDYFMLPLLLLLLIVLYVFCERAYFIGRAAKYNDTLMQRIKDYVHENEMESADNLCRQEGTPASSVLLTGLSLIGRPMGEIVDAMSLTASMEKSKLLAITRWLPFTAAAAPLAGLLGAVLGLLRTVYESTAPLENVQALFTPLMTVVVGLIVGLVALCCHHFLMARMNKVNITLDSVIARFIDLLNEPSA